MLTIRLQRTGRSGHAQFRMIVQDSRFSPTSGRVVDYVGNYNPHSKAVALDKEKIVKYLANGAQPSPRTASLLKKEGIKLPNWVKTPAPNKKEIKHPEKLRRNRPPEELKQNSTGQAAGEPAPEQPKPEVEETSIQETPAKETSPQEPTVAEAVVTEEKTKPEAPAEEIGTKEGAKTAQEKKEEPAKEKATPKAKS